MSNNLFPDVLYHYASMQKAHNILKNKNIRLSDITKSNDINEMSIFFPTLFDEILNLYDGLNGFNNLFFYKGKQNRNALELVISELKTQIDKEFKDGSIASFILCLSERGDLLSQWRGYSDDGKGLSIGFNTKALVSYIEQRKRTYELVKVVYLSDFELKNWIKEKADNFLWLIDTILNANFEDDIRFNTPSEFDIIIYNTLYFNLLEYIEESIQFKSDGFSEENEWRLFIISALSKEDVNIQTAQDIIDNGVLNEEIRKELNEFVFQNVEFNTVNNDIIPYISLKFDDFDDDLICDLICGPNNKIRIKDMQLLLRKYGYCGCSFSKSRITYITR